MKIQKLDGGLSDENKELLKKLVALVRQNESAFIRCGAALIEIREKNLWIEYPTFKAFCEATFGWNIRRAQQLIKATETTLQLSNETRTMVRSERAARALSKVPKESRESVLEKIASRGEVTAKKIEHEAAKPVEVKTLDALGREVPKPALPFWNRRDEPQEIAHMISSARSAVRKLQDTNDKLYVEVNMNEVLASLSKAYTEFKQSIPHAVCPYCQGQQPKTCIFCKGRGCVSRFRFDTMAPEELKKKK